MVHEFRVVSVLLAKTSEAERPWYAGDVRVHQPFGEGAHHDQDLR